MVIETDPYPGGYSHNDYSAYQGPNGSYSNFHGVSQQTVPFSGYPQGPTHSSSHAQQHQSGWSTGGGFPSNAASHFTSDGGYGSSYGNSHPMKPNTGGYGSSYGNSHPMKPNTGGYGSSYGSSHNHGMSHGQGYGSTNNHGHGGYGNSHGYGGGGAAHGSSGYGSGYGGGHGSSGMGQGYGQRPSWTLKGLDDEEE